MNGSMLDLLPDTAQLAAVVVVVIMFLRFIRSYMDRLSQISDACHATQKELQENYTKNLETVMHGHLAALQEISERMRSLESKGG